MSNENLRDELLETGELKLDEATRNSIWGTDTTLKSKEVTEGTGTTITSLESYSKSFALNLDNHISNIVRGNYRVMMGVCHTRHLERRVMDCHTRHLERLVGDCHTRHLERLFIQSIIAGGSKDMSVLYHGPS